MSPSSGKNEDKELTGRLSGAPCGDPGASSAVGAAHNISDHDPVGAYKRAAPRLLNELAGLLSQHKWTDKRRIPRGIVNILNYSWQDLTAGAVLKSPEQTDKQRKLKGSLELEQINRPMSSNDTNQTGSIESCVVGNVGPSERKTRVSSNPPVKKCKVSKKGWLTEMEQLSYDAPQQIQLCQWVVERLQAEQNSEKPQTAKQNQNTALILRHYGDAKEQKKAHPTTLVNGIPRIPEVKQQDRAQQKLYYRISDGSSFIYYRSGCMAVCQSHSGLHCGGLYTNVFSDSKCPTVLATITAFGHGAVTHPLSSAITAVWDQNGGFICDGLGSITKEWSWQTAHTQREILIQVSELIAVRLLSGTSAMLSFRCNDESVQLPLSALSNIHRKKKEMPCLQTDGKFISDAALELLLVRKTKSPVVDLEGKTPTITPARQMIREVEGSSDLSALWRRGGQAGRVLKRLQQRVQNTLDDWLEYYQVATGIKCPHTERLPNAPLKTRLGREVQSAALPSLSTPERANAKPGQSEEGRNELQKLHRHLSPTAESPPDSSVRLSRSVIIPDTPEPQPSTVLHCPAPLKFTPSVPLTACPVVLRAALLGEGGRRRCCCSATLMPVVRDLEYDAFVMGQPSNSQQILVVCVTLLRQPINTHRVADQDPLEMLYRRRNRNRTMPCTQCQMDSFRLVRYEISPGCGVKSNLLQQRHNAAPGMILMYIRGKLLFLGYICSDHSCSVRDLQKQISRSRGDYRLGLGLPPDYKFSETVSTLTDLDVQSSQHGRLT
uniref:FAM194 C-terminal domain-containing protein n=1 Tax=Monopterus albus TaxID=43700 RepID=A0A3Q3J849_MONAL